MSYRYESLNRLDESLRATAVLSEGYRKDVFGWALAAVGEAHAAGRKEAERATPALRFDLRPEYGVTVLATRERVGARPLRFEVFWTPESAAHGLPPRFNIAGDWLVPDDACWAAECLAAADAALGRWQEGH